MFWVGMVALSVGCAGCLYLAGFMHGRQVERDQVSDLRRALRALRTGQGPRVIR